MARGPNTVATWGCGSRHSVEVRLRLPPFDVTDRPDGPEHRPTGSAEAGAPDRMGDDTRDDDRGRPNVSMDTKTRLRTVSSSVPHALRAYSGRKPGIIGSMPGDGCDRSSPRSTRVTGSTHPREP